MATAVLLVLTQTASFWAPALKSLSYDLDLIVKAARRLKRFLDKPSLFTSFSLLQMRLPFCCSVDAVLDQKAL
jgi:hypothetical protein